MSDKRSKEEIREEILEMFDSMTTLIKFSVGIRVSIDPNLFENFRWALEQALEEDIAVPVPTELSREEVIAQVRDIPPLTPGVRKLAEHMASDLVNRMKEYTTPLHLECVSIFKGDLRFLTNQIRMKASCEDINCHRLATRWAIWDYNHLPFCDEHGPEGGVHVWLDIPQFAVRARRINMLIEGI